MNEQESTLPMTGRVWKYGVVYFALVFGAGFVLGTIRVFAVEPALGARWAELIEMPFMWMVIYGAAKWVVSKMQSVHAAIPFLKVGGIALGLLLVLEFTLVLGVQGVSMDQYLETRDGVAFGAYLLSLVVFALMPLVIFKLSVEKEP